MTHLGRKIRVIREYRNIMQTELAEMVGVSQGRISDIERGKIIPDTLMQTALETALGIQFDDPAVVAAFAVLSGSTTPIKP